jgi:hypothetical protein
MIMLFKSASGYVTPVRWMDYLGKGEILPNRDVKTLVYNMREILPNRDVKTLVYNMREILPNRDVKTLVYNMREILPNRDVKTLVYNMREIHFFLCVWNILWIFYFSS